MEQHDINYGKLRRSGHSPLTGAMNSLCEKEMDYDFKELRDRALENLSDPYFLWEDANDRIDPPVVVLSDEQQEAFLKNWEDAMPKLDIKNDLKGPIIYGTGGIDPCASDAYSKCWDDLDLAEGARKIAEKHLGIPPKYDYDDVFKRRENKKWERGWRDAVNIVPIEEAFKK